MAEVQTVDVTCPYCGLLCDDLSLRADAQGGEVVANGCAISRPAFARATAPAPGPRVGGQPATLEQAVAAAAAILARARHPLIAGLATDVAGMRAVMELADGCGAILDHMNAGAKFRNLLAVQDAGWITTTLGEVKNRADLIILAGTDVATRFPRFFERFVWNRETLFGLAPAKREIVVLGRDVDRRAAISPEGREPMLVPCEVERLGEACGVLRALLAGLPLQCEAAAGVPLDTWRWLAAKMKAARYGVIAWVAPDFDFPQADLTVRSLCELVKELNRHTRFSGLPLGGSEGDFTADAVELWQTGFPFRSRVGGSGPAYDPHLYAAPRLLAQGEVDALLWVASIDAARLPPEGSVPTVILGAVGMAPQREPEVFIPVGTPGVHHAAHMFRTDKVVALYLKPARQDGPPSVAQVVGAIAAQLAGAQGVA